MRDLSVEEVDHVSGSVGPLLLAAGGAVAGAVGYVWGTQNPSVSGLLVATGSGAIGGLTGGFAGSMIGTFGSLYANEIEDGPDPANVGSSKKYR